MASRKRETYRINQGFIYPLRVTMNATSLKTIIDQRNMFLAATLCWMDRKIAKKNN